MKADTVSTLQELVAGTWSEILKVDVHPQDNLFNLGATALDAILAGAQLSAKLGVTLPLFTVFDNPSVAEFVPALASLIATTEELIKPAVHSLRARPAALAAQR